MSNLYLRSAPPGFPPIPDSKSSSYLHTHHLDKMNYATNLFNKSSVESSSRVPAPISEMEVAGVFWDIENCAVPHQKSAFALVQRIRERMFNYLREVEFMVACDASKETKAVMDELNSAQVNIVHIKGTAKNAADEKLRQAIRRFADEHPPPATIIIITGDINFVPDIADLNNRKKYNVVLIYPDQAPDPLIYATSTRISYAEFALDLPPRNAIQDCESMVVVSNLPTTQHLPKSAIRNRLSQLFENTGGRVQHVFGKSASVSFRNQDMARRALKRLDGEDVFGNKITIREKAIFTDEEHRRKLNRLIPQSSLSSSASSDYAGARSGYTPSYASAVTGSAINKPRQLTLVKPPPVPQQLTDGVKLTITNIDAALGEDGIKEALTSKIQKCSPIIRLLIQPYNRFTMTADVVVPSMTDATSVLESCQRARLGKKRILVTLTQQSDMRMNAFRANVSYLIQDGNAVSLSELQAKYNEVFHDPTACSLENLRRLGPGFLKIEESVWSRGRNPCESCQTGTPCRLCKHDLDQINVRLATPIRKKPPNLRNIPQSPFTVSQPHCDRHVQVGVPVYDASMVKVHCSLREFAAKLHSLLANHHGILPLCSLNICWMEEFHHFPEVNSDSEGVYLEHLASFVPGVEIITSHHGHKIISWAQTGSSTDGDTESVSSSSTTSSRPRAPLGDPSVVTFGRELTELLKDHDGSSVALSQLNTIFSAKFGKLPFRPGVPPIQQLARLSHVVQVLGPEGAQKRVITLTHRAQVKRFTQETVKILKSLSERNCYASEYPQLYSEHFKTSFRLCDFGVCDLADLLSDVPEGHLETNGEGPDLLISLPKKNRTSDEIQRTKKFGSEVAELLCECDKFSLPFTAFVPHYHHHFGRQCRLSNYGFTKLQDLFEAIPDIVTIDEIPNDKRLSLTMKEKMAILTRQTEELMEENEELSLLDFADVYMQKFKRRLEPPLFEEPSIRSLLDRLNNILLLEPCLKTQRCYLRRVSKEQHANFLALRKDLLRALLGNEHTSSFIECELLQRRYEHICASKFESSRYAQSNTLTFEDLARRALSEFIFNDERGGFNLRPMFFEARRLWKLFHDQEAQHDWAYDPKKSNFINAIQVEFRHRYPSVPTNTIREIMDILSPILNDQNQGNPLLRFKAPRKDFRIG